MIWRPSAPKARKRVEDGAGAERGDEGVDLRHLDQKPIDQADQRGAPDHE